MQQLEILGVQQPLHHIKAAEPSLRSKEQTMASIRQRRPFTNLTCRRKKKSTSGTSWNCSCRRSSLRKRETGLAKRSLLGSVS